MRLALFMALTICPLSQPVIDKVVVNNYFAQRVWPSVIVARSPEPWQPLHDFRPEFYSSFDTFSTEIDNGDLSQWSLTTRVDGEGCYVATWSSGPVKDKPFSPLWCAGGYPQYCGERTNELLLVEVCDSKGNMATASVQCQQTSRGSKCVK